VKVNFRFTRKERLSDQEDFKSVIKYGRRISSRNLSIFIKANGLGFHRLGIVVKKELGRANYRNRIKRYFREFFRLNKHNIRGSLDIVILAKKDCIFKRYKDAEEELKKALI